MTISFFSAKREILNHIDTIKSDINYIENKLENVLSRQHNLSLTLETIILISTKIAILNSKVDTLYNMVKDLKPFTYRKAERKSFMAKILSIIKKILLYPIRRKGEPEHKEEPLSRLEKRIIDQYNKIIKTNNVVQTTHMPTTQAQAKKPSPESSKVPKFRQEPITL